MRWRVGGGSRFRVFFVLSRGLGWPKAAEQPKKTIQSAVAGCGARVCHPPNNPRHISREGWPVLQVYAAAGLLAFCAANSVVSYCLHVACRDRRCARVQTDSGSPLPLLYHRIQSTVWAAVVSNLGGISHFSSQKHLVVAGGTYSSKNTKRLKPAK